jgi:Tol biopolymer transport system component
MDTESDEAQRISLTTTSEISFAVSPDGRTIAFGTSSSEYDLVEVPIDGGGFKTLLETARNEQEPTWSPDGGYFAYVTDKSGNSQIWKRSLDGRTVNGPLVTERDFPGERTFLFSAPVFSPDGERIAYDRQAAYNRIYVSPVAGGQPVQLTTEELFQSSPTWAPDANSIAFVTVHDGRWALQRVDVGSKTSVVKLRDGVVPYSAPQWSPKGNWIAVLSTNPNGLVVVSPKPNGGTPEVILSEEAGWLVYGWSKQDDSRLYAIRNADGRMVLVSIDVGSKRETVLNPNLGRVPLGDAPVKGFSWMSPKSFATSVVRIRSEIWLMEGLKPPAGRFERFLPSWLRSRPAGQ